MTRCARRSRLLHGVKHHDDRRVAPAAAEFFDGRIALVAEARLTNGYRAQAGGLQRRQMLLDAVRGECELVGLAVPIAERALPAVLRPRRMKVGVDEVTASAQDARHFGRPGLKVHHVADGQRGVDQVERTALELYRYASEHAAARGILIADTKFEFGLEADGTLVLADEAFTPDSSRFWPADEYAPGGPQPSFDKQFVRDYCEALGWDKTPPGPELPDDVVTGTRARYVEVFERLTGIGFDDYLADPEVVGQ